MTGTAAPTIITLMTSLEELEELVTPQQILPLNHLAENAVVGWLRVVEGKEIVVPRLSSAGVVQGAFYYGMEQSPEHCIDTIPPAGDNAELGRQVESRLAALSQELEGYFSRSGYRSSSENCDQLLVELSRLSRFFSACCFQGQPPAAGRGEAGAAPGLEGVYTGETRGNMLIWEPVLNEAIVAWEQNSLNDLDAALRDLGNLLEMSPAERERRRVKPGYPFRPVGSARLKVSDFMPESRPLRMKSMFYVRYTQLMNLLEKIEGVTARVIAEMNSDIRHFIHMVRSNHYMLAGETGFWETNRAGLPQIRSRPSTHPFMLDAMDFFKKAVLFHNRTYTVQGGGVDLMYLQVRQLERFCKFKTTGATRELRLLVTACIRGWEENRQSDFTDYLLRIAKYLRAREGVEAS